MKKIILAAIALQLCYTTAYCQTPPVTSGLVLHLDAKVGFTPGDPPLTVPSPPVCTGGTLAGTPVYATWQDQSGMGNDVTTGDVVTWTTAQSIITCNNANPRYVTNVHNTGFDAIYFDGNDYMTTSPSFSGGLSAANGLSSADNVTETTLFVVRIGAPGYQGQAGDDRNGIMVSLTDTDPASLPGYNIPYPPTTPTNVRDEFSLMRDWAANIVTLTSAGHTIAYKEHQCFQQLYGYRPVVLSTTLGTNYSDVEYYINGLQSTEPLQVNPPAVSTYTHLPVDRVISIGARHGAAYYALGFHFSEPLEGYIFEVLVYNRKLSPAEVDEVNDFLKCKYDIRYSTCNTPIVSCPKVCWTSPSLDINYIGKDGLGNCIFECTANAQTMSGVTNFAYEWSVPGMPNMLVHSSAPTDVQTFTIPLGSANISVKLLGVNDGTSEDLPCCEYTLSRPVYCGDLDGGTEDYEKPGRTTTVQAIESIDGIAIYPNPTFDKVNIKLPDNNAYEIAVYDFTGKLTQKTTSEGNVTTLNFGAYAKGIYMIRISDNTGREVKVEKVMLK